MTSIPSDCLGQYARRADAAFRRVLKAKLLGSPNGWRGARGHRDLQNNCTALIEATRWNVFLPISMPIVATREALIDVVWDAVLALCSTFALALSIELGVPSAP